VERAADPDTRDAVPAAAYAPALSAGFQATASRVQEMHQAIAGKTFDNLLRVPGLAMPTRIVQGVHDAITQGVYAAVRHGGSAAFALAGGLERRLDDPARVPGAREQSLRSALNGAVGDALAAAGSALAVQMSLRDRDGPVTPERLTSLPARTCVFLHGLACDEHSWRLGQDRWAGTPQAVALARGEPITYGGLLEHELGTGALWLRYNTGLALEQNARQLAELLRAAAGQSPQVRDWVLVGHSMGGLVARQAHAVAAERGLGWATRTTMIVCLGSPHQGAPLATVGHATAAALEVSEVTRPLARLTNARSRGIKDLRRGLKGGAAPAPALRLVFGTLGDEGATGLVPLVGRWLGDGLVRAGSASADELTGAVQRVELAGLGHMSLLNHPRVYDVIRRWLGGAASAG
jgi:pimeloyl-ACP methyl ester carboxylesterase